MVVCAPFFNRFQKERVIVKECSSQLSKKFTKKGRSYGIHVLTLGSVWGPLSCWFLDSREAIIMGTHKEGGATSFWSYTLNLPLSSNALISWKFCYLLHKVLREGHRNARLNLDITSFYSTHPKKTMKFLFDVRLCFQ